VRSEPRVDSNRRIGFVPSIASTRLLRPATWALIAGAIACGASRHGPPRADDPSFYDYTTDRVETLAEFRQLAAVSPDIDDRPAVAGAKFVISDFSDPERRKLHFLDGRFYQFHDEWFWFRLLNGQSVPGGLALEPHAFREPEQARAWARAHEDDLPSGLELWQERLYAPEFYEHSLDASERVIGAGSLIHVDARPPRREEVWGFELDYSDPAGPAELDVFFELLLAAIPEDARGKLKWIARSPEQMALAEALARDAPERKSRVMTYSELSVPGETVVYSPGIVVGRFEAFRDLARLSEARPDSILLLGALPEYLPQARGLVTSIPQTPLAHLNLLAKGRKIANVYRGGLFEDPEIADLVRSRAPVVVSAQGNTLEFRRISEAQYERWNSLVRVEPKTLAPTDAANAPYVVDLANTALDALPGLAPLIGGKSTGMVRLLHAVAEHRRSSISALGFDTPDRPLAISVRAFREHLAPLVPNIRALLADPSFDKFKKLRFLALEGAERFQERFPSDRDERLAKSYLNPRAIGPIAEVVREGGLRRMIRKAPLPASVRAELERVVVPHFATYSKEQGLRFRSSSTVEDIEGFNGAGLYVSSTGFVEPRKAQGKLEKRASLADALRKTWASYYGAEAFEERRDYGIDHLAADMAVLVHARFDDALEQSNGVFTFTLGGPEGAELSVNVQPGAVSVTNPPTDRPVTPESTRVRRRGSELAVERVSLSSIGRAGVNVLSDAELRDLYVLAEDVTRTALARANQGVPKERQRRSLTLDFEFRRVAAGWPALREGRHPSRFVVKQMRPLEPSPRVDAPLRSAPIPHDVLARARRIERRRCSSDRVELSFLSVLTDPHAEPDLGYARTPLLAELTLDTDPKSERGARTFTHLELAALKWVAENSLDVDLRGHPGATRLELRDSELVVFGADAVPFRVTLSCSTNVEYAEPTELLRSYLLAPKPESKSE
jgi:hypothetical protein